MTLLLRLITAARPQERGLLLLVYLLRLILRILPRDGRQRVSSPGALVKGKD
jgi:hypothetical protein